MKLRFERRMVLSVLWVLPLFLGLISCGKAKVESVKTSSSNSTLINGKTPQDYYNQFKYAENGNCKDGMTFRSLVTNHSIKVGNSTDGSEIKAEMTIFLLDGDKYVALYHEFTVEKQEGDDSVNRGDANRRKEGTWSIQDTSIVLSGLGTGRALKFNDVDVIDFKFSGENSEKLNGTTSMLFRASTSTSYKPYSEYCPGSN